MIASNGVGAPAASAGATLTVSGGGSPPVGPIINTQPTSQTSLSGSNVTFLVNVTGTQPILIQWQKNGVNLSDSATVSGSTTSTLTLTGVTKATAGNYTAIVSGSGTSLNSTSALLTVVVPSRLINLSIRAVSGPGAQTLIAGFVISGGSKSLLLRGIGPGLLSYGVNDVVMAPEISLYNGPTLAQSNAGWGGSTVLAAAAFNQVGAFPLSAKASSDSALLATVPLGSHTVQLSGSNSGIALAEIYDADVAEVPAGRFINVSARAQIGTGGDVAIAGFVVSGDTSEHVLIRAIGPSLSQFGVSGVLATPQLAVYDKNSTLIQSNAGWGGTAELQEAFANTGAFPLTSSSADSALIATLTPGTYTAIVSGANETSGIALLRSV